MKPKYILLPVVLLAAAALFLGLVGGRFGLLVGLHIVRAYLPLFVGAVAALLIAAVIAWRVMPRRVREPYSTRKMMFGTMVLVSGVFFASVGWVVNKLWMPAKLHPLSLVADGAIGILTIFLLWSLVSRSQQAVIRFFVATWSPGLSLHCSRLSSQSKLSRTTIQMSLPRSRISSGSRPTRRWTNPV